MTHHHEPPATLTEAEWDTLEPIFKRCGQSAAFALLRRTNNQPQRAGDLFAPAYVYSRGQTNVNRMLGKAGSDFVLSRVDYTITNDGTAREDRMLALVRKAK